MKCPHCNYNTPDNSVRCCVCDKQISTQSPQSDWKDFAKFSREAIAVFANKGILLDSTPASLLGLDIYMDETWGTDGFDTGNKGVTPGDQHQQEMWLMGCYLGEMLRTIMKGEWKPDPQQGDDVWFYLIVSPNDVRICPHAWLRKRWKYGAGDRLYDKLIGIVGMYDGKQTIKSIDGETIPVPKLDLSYSNKPEDWLKHGNHYFGNGRWQVALRFFEIAAKLNSGLASAWFGAAQCQEKLDLPGQAAESYRRFLELAGKEPHKYGSEIESARKRLTALANQKSDVVWETSAEENDVHVKNRAAEPTSSKPVENGDSDFWGRKGVELCQQNNIEEGLDCLKKCVAMNANNPLGWFFKGKAEYTLGLIQDATASLQRFISMSPQFNVEKLAANIEEAQTMIDDLLSDSSVVTAGMSVLDLKKRAWSLGLKGRIKEALGCILAAVAIEPDDFELWQMKSIYEEKLGKTQDAIQSCRKYIQLAPPEMESVVAKVKERLKRLGGEVPAEIRNVEKPTTKNTEQAKQLVREANEHLQKQRHAEALRLVDIAISYDPSYVGAHFLRGTCLYMLGRFREALTSLTKVLELAPDDKMVHFTRGLVEFELRMTTEAVFSLKKFLAHADPKFQQQIKIAREYLRKLGVSTDETTKEVPEPKNGTSAMFQAVALALKGQKQQAIDMFAKAVRLSPQDALIWWTKGTFEDKYGMKTEAIESFKKVLVLAGPDMAETLQKTKARLRELGVDPEKAVPNIASLISEGKAFMEKRRYSLAVGSFEKAIAADSNNAEAWFLKAQAEEMSGLKRRAIESYKRFLQLASPEKHSAQIEIAKKLLESVK